MVLFTTYHYVAESNRGATHLGSIMKEKAIMSIALLHIGSRKA